MVSRFPCQRGRRPPGDLANDPAADVGSDLEVPAEEFDPLAGHTILVLLVDGPKLLRQLLR